MVGRLAHHAWSWSMSGAFSLYLVQTHTDWRGASMARRAAAVAGKRDGERKKQHRFCFPSSLSLSLSTSVHSTVDARERQRERERERERDAVAVGKVVLCARTRSTRRRRDRALRLRGGYGFLTDALKALAYYIETAGLQFSLDQRKTSVMRLPV